MTDHAGLRPVAGEPRDVLDLVRPWVIDGGDPIVVRTSGSTGAPKDVVLSHRAVLASARATHERLGGPGQWLSALPVSGVGGLQVLVRSVLAGVDPVFGDDHASLEDAVSALDGPRRYASLVPTQLHRLIRDGRGDALAGLDAVLIGGAAVPADLLADARAAGVTVVRTYGMSETCGGCVYDGVPLDGVRLRIDGTGQILIGGDVLFDCYADPTATARVLVDGWFATADLGSLDAAGRLTVTGRADDVVHSGGVNVGLPAVTEALRGHGGVTDAVALGVPDPEWGHRVVAFVIGSGFVTLEALRDGVEAAGRPRTWAPRQLVLLDDLPLLPGGKIDRQKLIESVCHAPCPEVGRQRAGRRW